MSTVRVRVPATTANLGPGFDALGIALRIYNTVTVTSADSPGDDAMAQEAARRFYHRTGLEPIHFQWSIEGDVPRSRGMGSSVTVRLGILHGLNALHGSPLDAFNLFEICSILEGHPDNAAPAAFGGFCICRGHSKVLRFPIDPDLHFVLLVPDFEISTPEARKVLPATIPLTEAAASAGNAAAIAAAFASKRYEDLRGCFRDGIHQPYRKELIPCLDSVIAAGEGAGALGGWLSGSGSTICCLTAGDPEPVSRAMFEAAGILGARILITRADEEGIQVAAGE